MASLGFINIVKYTPSLYNIYYYVGSIAVRVFSLFIRKDPKLIVFSCYGGRKYDDSPKCVYEQMINDSRFDGFKIVWAFMQPEHYEIPRGEKVKIDTIAYYKVLLRARCWITNSTMERGLSFKDDKTFYYNSWHGTPIKLMGCDISKDNKSFGSKRNGCPYDIFCAQSKYDAEIFTRSFGVPENSMKIIGLPRNDELVNNAGEERMVKIKTSLGIDPGKKILLYAPTFREYVKDENFNCVIAPPIDLMKWKNILGKDYVLLFRAHYEVVKVMNIHEDDFIRNVSFYPNLNELMIVSDMLISDYSSIFFDYSVMHKPIICFAYDYDEYAQKRGMYFDIRKWLPYASDEDDLLKQICDTDITIKSEVTKRFQKEYVSEYGHATEKSLDLIYKGIKG